VNPPETAVILCVCETTQAQALDRMALILPLSPGTPAGATHDYRRHGLTNLCAALDVAPRLVTGDLTARHRSEECGRFLALTDKSVPEGLGVHAIPGNSSTRKTPAILRWLVCHPRSQIHCTPSCSLWLSLVERWFAELTARWLRRGNQRSTRELVASIRSCITGWNENSRPFIWHETADQILESLASHCQRINGSGH